MNQKYKLSLNLEYEIEAENFDEARNELENQFGTTNTTAENEFWDNIEVEEINEI